jgi:uncharacterized protein (TIGR03067 family)
MNPFKPIVFVALRLSCVIAFAGEPAEPNAVPARPDAVKTDAIRIQGTWKVVALEAQGTQAPAEIVAAMRLVFKDATLTFDPGEPGFTKYTFKLDPTAKPPTFDMTQMEGKRETQKGIYALEGDTLKICIGLADRPKAFPVKEASQDALYTMKRAKP